MTRGAKVRFIVGDADAAYRDASQEIDLSPPKDLLAQASRHGSRVDMGRIADLSGCDDDVLPDADSVDRQLVPPPERRHAIVVGQQRATLGGGMAAQLAVQLVVLAPEAVT